MKYPEGRHDKQKNKAEGKQLSLTHLAQPYGQVSQPATHRFISARELSGLKRSEGSVRPDHSPYLVGGTPRLSGKFAVNTRRSDTIPVSNCLSGGSPWVRRFFHSTTFRFTVLTLRVSFGLQFVKQPYPSFGLVPDFRSRIRLLHHFFHPGLAAFSFWFAALSGRCLRTVFHRQDGPHSRHTKKGGSRRIRSADEVLFSFPVFFRLFDNLGGHLRRQLLVAFKSQGERAFGLCH